MATTTRGQADTRGLDERDIVSLDQPQADIHGALVREEERKGFENKGTLYWALFCLTENIPNNYMSTLKAHHVSIDRLLEITSADPDPTTLLGQCKLNFLDLDADKPMPFVGWTVEACYDFFDKVLIPTNRVAEYTFLAIDEQCVQAEPPEIIVGTDAGDYDERPEDPPKLKIIRQPIQEVMQELDSLEQHTRTPNEVISQSPMGASVMPEAVFARDPRAYKRAALSGLPGPEAMSELHSMGDIVAQRQIL